MDPETRREATREANEDTGEWMGPVLPPEHVVPNILFIFSDQQRWDTMGCYGQELPVTPNLDGLAAEGVLFEHAFTVQPVCGPARSCLQTGLYASQTGCFRNAIALPVDADTVAKRLSACGYETAYIGKWHLASTRGSASVPLEDEIDLAEKAVPPERRGGFEYWLAADALEHTSHGPEGGYMFDGDGNKVEFGGYRVDSHTDFVIDYLENKRDKDRPFYLFVSYIEPHHQNDRGIYEGPEGSKEMFKDFKVPGDLEGTAGDWLANYPDYLGCCWSIDRNLGRIIDTLEKQGLKENTLIIYTSDHGSHFRTRNAEYKRSCHESSIRIPMILNGPGFKGGKTVDSLVSLLDLVPTVHEAARCDPPDGVQGRPLQELGGDVPPGDWPDDVYVQISESNVGRAIRTEKWKYSLRAPGKSGRYDPSSSIYVEDCLYNLETDPHERTNLVDDEALVDVRRMLANRMRARMREAGEAEPSILPRAALPRSRSLEASGLLHESVDGNVLVMDIIAFGKNKDDALEIPLSDMLEEMDGKLVAIEVASEISIGTMVIDAGAEHVSLRLGGGNTVPLVALLEPLLDTHVQLIQLAPSLELLDGVASLDTVGKLACHLLFTK